MLQLSEKLSEIRRNAFYIFTERSVQKGGIPMSDGNTNEPDNKRYYLELLSAIRDEYELYGFCGLIDDLLMKNNERPDLVTGSALLTYLHETDHPFDSDPEWPGENLPFVKYEGMDVLWTQSDLIALPAEISGDQLLRIREHGQTCHCKKLQEMRKELDKAGKIIAAAKAGASDILAGAQREGESLIDQGRRKRKELVDEGLRKKEELVDEGLRKKEELIGEGCREKEALLMEAAQEAGKKREEILAAAVSDAGEKSRRLLAEFLSQEQERTRVECSRAAAHISEEERNDFSAAEKLHEDMCERTDHMYGNLVRQLDSVKESLEKMKRDVYSHLHDWQVSLYPREFRPLAMRYQELYRILNIQKLITGMILQTDTIASEAARNSQREIFEKLEKLQTELEKFLRRYEKALNGLGMYVFVPDAGEAFDEYFHVWEDGSPSDLSPVIERCIIPGINKRSKDGQEEVVVRAIVGIRQLEKMQSTGAISI